MHPLDEPAASPLEQAEADRLDHVLAQLEQDRPVADAEPFVRDLARLYELGGAFRPPLDCPAYTTISQLPAMSAHDPFPGEFRLLRPLGFGGFGEVWLADDLNLGRQVALKGVRLSTDSGKGAVQLTALRNDARCLAALRHPRIVQVHAWRQAEGAFYLVLEYISGGSFADRLKKEGPLDWQRAARYVADVGEALVEVHKKGVIHCDIKPANILWNPEGDQAFVTDFGVSLHLAEGGRLGGTIPYMPPEAFAGTVLPAFDVYSLAATLFQFMTGTVPFQAKTISELLKKTRQGLPEPDARLRDVPEALENVVRAGLNPDPGRRPSLADFVARLRRDLNHLLADSLALPIADEHLLPPLSKDLVNLRLAVSRRLDGNRYTPVAATHPQLSIQTRNMKKVPPLPDQVKLRTGDRVRIEVIADRTGYVTVFNVGPTGDLNVLYPDEPVTAEAPPSIQANVPLNVLDVEMQPPAGRERVFAVWTGRPLSLELEKLQALAAGEAIAVSAEYLATRNMVKVRHGIEQGQSQNVRVTVLEVEHLAN